MSKKSPISVLSKTSGYRTIAAMLMVGMSSIAMAATADYVSINDAGTTRDNKNSDGATGTNAVAIGVNATSSGLNSQAFGTNAASSGSSSISVGTNSSATGDAASAYGQDAHASANGATAIGRQSVASGSGSIAMGSAAQASAQDATALGPTSNASGNASISIGTQSSATEGQSVAIGRGASATEDSSVALGSYSTTSAAVGTTSATVNGVTYSGFAGTAPASTVSVGSSGAERTVTNVAAGRITADSTDAINGSQLYQVADQVGTNTTNIANNTTAINNINTQVNNYGDQINNINNRIDDMDKDLRAGIAGATAIAFLQRPNEAGKSMVSMAVGGYRGEQALAVGYARNSDNNKWSTKAGVGIDTQKHVNWGGSVGYQW